MKIVIENTDQIVELLVNGFSVPARLWKGTTESGIDVQVLVTRIGVSVDQDQTQFEKEPEETPATRAEDFWQVFPIRLVLWMLTRLDSHCYDLACHFLDDVKGATEKQRQDLASTIQGAIEDWLDDQDSEQESARDMAAERDGDEARDLGMGESA